MNRLLLTFLAIYMAAGVAGASIVKKAHTQSAPVSRAAVLPSEMSKVLMASYDPQDDDVADYYFILSNLTSATWTKEGGPAMTDGFALRLDCYAPVSSSPIVLAEGTYTASDSYSAMTYDPDFSYLEYYDETGAVTETYDLTGDLTVSKNADGAYVISVPVDGGTITYTGLIMFDDGTMEPTVFTQIKKDLDLTLDGALAFYDGNLYESNTGSLYINLYDHEFNPETGGMTEDGFSLALQVFGRLFSDPKNAAPDPGTYTVGREFRRFTWYPGTELEYMGMVGLMGCYAKERNSTTYSDGFAYSYLSDGTIEIEDLGAGVFRITVDAVTTYGHTVKATFEGKVPVIDKSEGNSKSAISTLEEDVDLALEPIPVCRAFNGGVTNGCQTFIVDIGSPAGRDGITEGDILRMEFVLPEGTQYLQGGTYTVMDEKWDSYYEPYKLGKGRFMSLSDGSTDLSGTRYMHFEEGRTLIMDHYAPADEGTVGVTKNADDTWTFNVALIDDAQFRITGSWTGPMELMYDPEYIVAGIADVSADQESVSFEWLDSNTLCLVGAGNASAAVVYNTQGAEIPVKVSGNLLSFSGVPAGIYIIKYNTQSIKIVKK